MIVLHELTSNSVLSFFKTAPIPHGLDKITDIQGYLVINSDGAVLAVSVWLSNQTFDLQYIGTLPITTWVILHNYIPIVVSVVDHR